jgi:hypothetical protein
VRDHAGPETTDPATYRQRYAQYKSDPAELVCSSITSGGDGSDSRTGSHPWLAGGQNPHLRFQNSLRGYVQTMITREEMTADFRVLPYVSRPGAEAFTRRTGFSPSPCRGPEVRNAQTPLMWSTLADIGRSVSDDVRPWCCGRRAPPSRAGWTGRC